MTIFGIGIDIVNIARIKNVLKKHRNRFINRILSTLELQEYKTYYRSFRFIAKRFAVKEAAMKALGTGFRYPISFSQFEIFYNDLGKPKLRLLKDAKNLFLQLKINKAHVNFSDERRYVVATVILERQ